MNHLKRGAGAAQNRNDANKKLRKEIRTEFIQEQGKPGKKFSRLMSQTVKAAKAGNKNKVNRKIKKLNTVYKSLKNPSRKEGRKEFQNFKSLAKTLVRQYMKGK